MIRKSLLLLVFLPALAALLTGCLTQRTVTDGGVTTSQEIVIKRPVKELLGNSQ